MSQRARVLDLLRAAGDGGIHTFELRAQFIGNPSQRVAELEALGHKISHTRERLNGKAVGTRYRLVEEAGGSGGPSTRLGGTGHAVVAETGGPPDALSLFDQPTDPPRSAYEEAA